MNCLSTEQLAGIALGIEENNDCLAHIQQCPTCQVNLAQLDSLNNQLTIAHQQLNDSHATSRAQLISKLPEINTRPQTISVRQQLSLWLEGLTMRQRLAFGGLGFGAIIFMLLIAGTGISESASAMERMLENLRKAKSYQCDVIQQANITKESSKTLATTKIKLIQSWQAPGSIHQQLFRQVNKSDASMSLLETVIYPAGQPGIEINHRDKSYRHKQARLGKSSPFMLLDNLSTYAGQADKDLGTKKIDGKIAHGFVIDMKKIDPDSYSGPVEIWIDTESDLPVFIEVALNTKQLAIKLRFENFRWNVQLEPDLFDTTQPEGFTDATPEKPSLEVVTDRVVKALRLYSRLSKGHYPKVKIVYGDVVRDEMLKMAGIEGPINEELYQDERYTEILGVTVGFATINQIQRNNPDSAYYGMEAGPLDSDRILLRWKLEDDHHQIIFGDLTSQTVSTERLKALEENSK